MVCCAAYWRRHEIDEAGKVGTSLQKILFFLSAVTAVSFLSCEPTTVLCGFSALLLYVVGLIGAQKRDIRYLWAYGAVSIVLIVLSLVFGVVILGLVLSHGGLRHQSHGGYVPNSWHANGIVEPHVVAQHGVYLESGPIATTKPAFKGVYVESQPQAELMNAVAKDLLQKRQAAVDETFKIKSLAGTKVALTPIVENDFDSDIPPPTHQSLRPTALGWTVLSMAAIVSLVLFGLKVKSICLAFRMRRMLVALAAQRLPITISAPATTMTPTAAPIVAHMPAVRRDCERCTFSNAVGAVRCAMCDSPLPLVAAPVSVVPPPRVYAPGALYPSKI